MRVCPLARKFREKMGTTLNKDGTLAEGKSGGGEVASPQYTKTPGSGHKNRNSTSGGGLVFIRGGGIEGSETKKV